MAWVRTTEPHEGHRLFNASVVNSTSIRPRTEASMVNALRQVSFENEDSNLTQLQLEMIATVVSATNECRYWAVAHAELALGAGGSVELTQQLKDNYREADLTEAELAMLEFAELLTIQPANVVESDVQRLREVGWVDEDIVDIVHQTAMYNYMVRVADGLGVELSENMQNAEVRDAEAVDTRIWGRKNREAVSATGDD